LFEGLPENWLRRDKGFFSEKGKVPKIGDNRVSFVKGLYQDVLKNFLKNQQDLRLHKITLVINIDCDLYSSTLYVLNN